MGLFGLFGSSSADDDSVDFRSKISGMDVVELGEYWTKNRSFSSAARRAAFVAAVHDQLDRISHSELEDFVNEYESRYKRIDRNYLRNVKSHL